MMGWPYHFVDLNDDQKLERRRLLDSYASLAQISVLIPLLAIQIYFLVSRLDRRKSGGDVPGSPRRKEEHFGRGSGLTKIRELWRRIQWWCGEPVDFAASSLGSRGDVLAAVTWFAWLLFLCFPETGDDYLHLTKRFGIVAASQLPLHYLLAMKSSWSPLQILTRCSHETLNTFHQLLGRIILTLLYLHVSFYLNFYIQKDLLASKIEEAYIICGILGISSLTVLGTTALDPIRRWNYRLFYITHMVVAGLMIWVLWFHVSHIRRYIVQAYVIYSINIITRKWVEEKLKFPGTVKHLPNTDMIEINIPLPSSLEDSGLRRYAQPGQHAYVSLDSESRSRTFVKNPFSIASIPSTDGQLRFIARILDGNTALMSREASLAKDSSRQIHVEGPYGVTHSEKLLQYDRVLFVAGGVGGTFIVPLYRQLLSDLSPSRGSYRRQKVTFVWIAQKMADVAWALPEDSKEREGFLERLEVYLTRADGGQHTISNGGTSDVGRDTWAGSSVENEDGIELEERKNLLASDSNSTEGKSLNGLSIQAGRPDLGPLVGKTLSQGSDERVAVFVCGPNSLSRALRVELRNWGKKGKDIFYWEEEFAL